MDPVGGGGVAQSILVLAVAAFRADWHADAGRHLSTLQLVGHAVRLVVKRSPFVGPLASQSRLEQRLASVRAV